MRTMIHRDVASRLWSTLLLLTIAGCGGAPKSASDSANLEDRNSDVHAEAIPAVEASRPDDLDPAALLVKPNRQIGDHMTLYWAGAGEPPEVQAFDFQGGTLLLHVLVYVDYRNQPDGGVSFLPDADEDEPIREIRSSFLLGPFPQGLNREPLPDLNSAPEGEPAPLQIAVARKGLLVLEADHVRLIVRQEVARKQGARSGDSTETFWKSTAYHHPVESDAQLPRVRITDYRAANQHPLTASFPTMAGTTRSELQFDRRISAGDSDRIHWMHASHSVQTALIVHCLPFGPEPDDNSLREKIAELEAVVNTSPEDRMAQYHLAWGNYLLSRQPAVSREEKREKIQQSVAMLRRLCEVEPANFAFRDALRDHLIVHLLYESRNDPEQAEEIVDEFVQLQPVFDECLNAARFVLQTPELAADRKAGLVSQLLRAGLTASANSPALTQAHLHRFRQVFSDDTLSAWGVLGAERAGIDHVIDEFEKSVTPE